MSCSENNGSRRFATAGVARFAGLDLETGVAEMPLNLIAGAACLDRM